MTIILSCDCSLAVVAVPHRTQGQCLFSQEWEDIWVEPKQGAKVGTMDISTEYLQYIYTMYPQLGRANLNPQTCAGSGGPQLFRQTCLKS